MAIVAVVAACSDPVLDDAVDTQGNETAGISPGEYHRAGQRCTLCHQAGGKASGSPFTLAGTIFAQPNREVGVAGVEIRLADADGTKYTAKTNCVGNFFVKAADWQPKFPIIVDIFKGGVRQTMKSPIGREKDCGACHALANPVADPFSQMPHIYLYSGDEPGFKDGDPTCKVDPVRPGTK